MIKINLLPKDLRKHEHKIILPNRLHVFAVMGIFLILHIFLFLFAVIKKVQLVNLKSAWSHLEPDSKKYSETKKEVKDLEARAETVKSIFSRKASFTELFSSLNAAVPQGLWLERFSLSKDGLLIQGSVISLSQNEMGIISTFLQGLKNDAVYSSLFSKIELTSVQRRSIKNYDVVDFILAGDSKE